MISAAQFFLADRGPPYAQPRNEELCRVLKSGYQANFDLFRVLYILRHDRAENKDGLMVEHL